MSQPLKLAVILTGGGARAAYQVGVLKYLIENFPQKFKPTVWCGTSAGAINTSFVVQFADDLPRGIHNLYELWASLTVHDIYRLNTMNLTRMGLQLLGNVVRGNFWVNARQFRSLFDSRPLHDLLTRTISHERIARVISEGHVNAVTVTTTEYGTGKAVIFVHSSQQDTPQWTRVQRESRNTKITVDHIMASSALPMLFPAYQIGGVYYGDGSLRDKAPLSPAAKLGANKILAIGVRGADEHVAKPEKSYPSVASIGGTLANGIFLDALDADYENLARVNRLLNEGRLEKNYKSIQAFFLRPSNDLAKLSIQYMSEIPPVMSKVFRGFGKANESSSEFLSYVLFSGGYARTLMDHGYADGRLHHKALEEFLSSSEPVAKLSA